MCGIVGIYAYHYAANPVDRQELRKIRDHMTFRGPDGSGEWLCNSGQIGLGHRRLAIIDLTDGGSQPMVSSDGKVIITFNGEIYNYRQIRSSLQNKGYVFRTRSDTEVLLHLYAEKGEEMVHDLRGMFAFGLWDTERKGLLLARDPYGIKPLYYADDGWTLRFASQVKALLAGERVSRIREPAGLAGFCLFGSVPEPFTTYQEIRSVPAGAWMWIDAVGPRREKKYFSIAKTYAAAEMQIGALDIRDIPELVRTALLDSVRHHLVADVPVGAFLSSGIDSGALVGLMRDAGQDSVQTITLAFDEFRGRSEDEAPLAQEVALRYGTKHATRRVSEEEFASDLPKIVERMDQPTIDGINTWFVSKAARELGLKVAVSGLGGDELFGSYSSFRDIPNCVRAMRGPSRVPGGGKALRSVLAGPLLEWGGINQKWAGLLEYGGSYEGAYLLRRAIFMPWELPDILGPEVATEGLRRLNILRHINAQLMPRPRSDFGVVATLESSLYMNNQLLRDTDWSSMAHSLEVRVPLVDATLIRCLAPLSAVDRKWSKSRLANSPTRPLPRVMIDRRKTGFEMPLQKWLRRHPRAARWETNPILHSKRGGWARRWAFELVSG